MIPLFESEIVPWTREEHKSKGPLRYAHNLSHDFFARWIKLRQVNARQPIGEKCPAKSAPPHPPG